MTLNPRSESCGRKIKRNRQAFRITGNTETSLRGAKLPIADNALTTSLAYNFREPRLHAGPVMNNRSSVILALFLAVTFPAFGQRQPLTLCIVQTKPNPAIQYDPSAGRYAIAMNKQMQGHRLQDRTPLNIIVLASSVDKDCLLYTSRCV